MKNSRYVPREFVAGFYNWSISEDATTKFGVLSCKWRLSKSYTQVSQFSNLTGGIKPHNQRNAEVQIKKDLGISMQTFTNEPVEGFTLVSVGARLSKSTGYCGVSYDTSVIKDPRGFCVQIGTWQLSKLLASGKASIVDGKLSGKYAYCWYRTKFYGLVDEDALNDEDILDESKEPNGFCLGDVVPGKCYIIDISTSRLCSKALYLGDFNFKYTPSALRSINDELMNYHDKIMMKYDSCVQERARRRIRELMCNPKNTSSKLQPTFIILDEDMHSTSMRNASFADKYSPVNVDGSIDNAIAFTTCPIWHGYVYGSTIFGDNIKKKIFKLSEDQDIKLVPPRLAYSRTKNQIVQPVSTSMFKTMDFNKLRENFQKFLDEFFDKCKCIANNDVKCSWQ